MSSWLDTTPRHIFVEEYRESGFRVLRGVFGFDEVGVLRGECDRLWATAGLFDVDNLRTHAMGRDTGDAVDRLDPVIDLSAAFAALADHQRVRELASTVLGEEARLFKDKLIFKPPGFRGYGLHQDYTYWQSLAPAEALATVIVAIDPATAENGAVEAFPGVRELLTPPGQIRDVEDSQVDTSCGELLELRPGDVALLHPCTPHRSARNATASMRRHLLLSYGRSSAGDLYTLYHARTRRALLDALTPAARAKAYWC
jgi:2-aminoethylphosphonate dioxygenase